MKRALYLATLLIALSQPAQAREQIRIVGSGTLYPFITTAAEQFGLEGQYKTPIVESTGTGGGFKLFCGGTGEETPDINNASRKITPFEQEFCAKNSVAAPMELQIGFDGIILANKKGGASFNLTKKQIFMALARSLPDASGKLVPNTLQNWHEIDPSLPNQPIKIYGPGTVSGTRDAFAELVMEKGCEAFPEFAKAYKEDKDRKKICQAMREDGRYVESGEDYNIIIQKLISDEQALGIFGFSFYEQNLSRIQASKIDGVIPENDSIVSGKYGISRGLYVYIKTQHLSSVPSMSAFLKELTSEDSIGPDGYTTAKGLIPLTSADRKLLREKVSAIH